MSWNAVRDLRGGGILPLLEELIGIKTGYISFYDIFRTFYKTYPEVVSLFASVFLIFLIKHRKPLWRKLNIFMYSFWYMLVSKDTRGLKAALPVPGTDHSRSGKVLAERWIVFIRHGESEWNNIFNEKPKYMVPFRLIKALFREIQMLVPQFDAETNSKYGATHNMDSVFLDSPLNERGKHQGVELEKALRQINSPLFQDCVFLTSPLRRAITTLLLAFKSRLVKDKQTRVWVWDSLQEISRNIDTQSLTPAQTRPHPSVSVQVDHPTIAYLYQESLEPMNYKGSKTRERTGVRRLEEFVKRVFTDDKVLPLNKTVVIGGHSLWFKNFFNLFLPTDAGYLGGFARTQKIKNGGAVAFKLQKVQDTKSPEAFYRVLPSSIKEVHLGFEGH